MWFKNQNIIESYELKSLDLIPVPVNPNIHLLSKVTIFKVISGSFQ